MYKYNPTHTRYSISARWALRQLVAVACELQKFVYLGCTLWLRTSSDHGSHYRIVKALRTLFCEPIIEAYSKNYALCFGLLGKGDGSFHVLFDADGLQHCKPEAQRWRYQRTKVWIKIKISPPSAMHLLIDNPLSTYLIEATWLVSLDKVFLEAIQMCDLHLFQ